MKWDEMDSVNKPQVLDGFMEILEVWSMFLGQMTYQIPSTHLDTLIMYFWEILEVIQCQF